MITFSYFGSDGQHLSRSVNPLKLIFKSKDCIYMDFVF